MFQLHHSELSQLTHFRFRSASATLPAMLPAQSAAEPVAMSALAHSTNHVIDIQVMN